MRENLFFQREREKERVCRGYLERRALDQRCLKLTVPLGSPLCYTWREKQNRAQALRTALCQKCRVLKSPTKALREPGSGGARL